MADILSGESEGKVIQGSTQDEQQKLIADALVKLMQGNLGKPGESFVAPENQGKTALTDLLAKVLGTNVGMDPAALDRYIQDTVMAPAMKTFKETTLPQIKESYVGPGTFWGSERGKAEATAGTDLAGSLAGTSAGIRYQALSDQRGLELSKLGLGSSIAGNLASLSEGDINRRLSEWVRTRPENSQYLQMAMQYLGLPLTYSFYQGPKPGLLESIFGLVGDIWGREDD